MTASYTIEWCIQGYHVYKDVWAALPDEILTGQNEFEIVADLYADAVITFSHATVDHVRTATSNVCHSLLRRSGSTFQCQVTGSWRYSSDLPKRA